MGFLCDLAVRFELPKNRQSLLAQIEPFVVSKRTEAKRVLVISSGHSLSLKVWLEFFPAAYIYGIGGDKAYTQDLVGFSGRYLPFMVGGEDPKVDFLGFLEEVRGKFDFIVDEGVFSSKNFRAVVELLLPRLKIQGLYILEDVLPPQSGSLSMIEQLKEMFFALSTFQPPVDQGPLMTLFFDRLLKVYLGTNLVLMQVGLKPCSFDEEFYLARNPDVARAISAKKALKSGYHHYVLHGVREGRVWRMKSIKLEVLNL